jgi:hypothetical protein
VGALIVGAGSHGVLAGSDAPPGSVPSWVQLDTALTVNREVLDTRWSTLVRTPASRPDYSLLSARGSTAWSASDRIGEVVDLSPATPVADHPQVLTRPQFAFRGSSESLRSWLRIAGVEATHCIAPEMRMNSTFAGAGAHANVSVSARCNIH